MRKTKFRGQDIYTKKWVYGYFSECIEPMDEPVCLSYITDIENNSWIVYPETVGQCTGVTDKKRTDEFPEGQEIYEGDLFERRISMIEIPTGKQSYVYINCPVVFDDGCFKAYEQGWGHFNLKDILYWQNKAEDHFTTGEIIGNIHDNPELLK